MKKYSHTTKGHDSPTTELTLPFSDQKNLNSHLVLDDIGNNMSSQFLLDNTANSIHSEIALDSVHDNTGTQRDLYGIETSNSTHLNFNAMKHLMSQLDALR
jgi:hypothetical protein